MTVSLESDVPRADEKKTSGQSGDGEFSPTGGSSEEDVVVIDDDTDDDDDDVVFVSSTTIENRIENSVQLPKPIDHGTQLPKPLNVVKPFGFETTHEILDDDDDSEAYYRKLFREFEKEDAESIASSSEDFQIHDLFENTTYYPKKQKVNLKALSEETIRNYSLVEDCCVCIQNLRPRQGGKGRKKLNGFLENTIYHPEKLEVNLKALSEETIRNYSLVKDCCVCIQHLRPRQGEKERKRRFSFDDSNLSDDSDDSNDPLYIPDEPSTNGKKGRKRPSSENSNDPSYVPDEPSGPTKDLTVYQNIPLNKQDANRSRITLCERVLDFIECWKPPKTAIELCMGYWDNLSIREKRKYLPRSKYAQCMEGADDSKVQTES